MKKNTEFVYKIPRGRLSGNKVTESYYLKFKKIFENKNTAEKRPLNYRSKLNIHKKCKQLFFKIKRMIFFLNTNKQLLTMFLTNIENYPRRNQSKSN